MKHINIRYSEYLELLDYKKNIDTFFDESECLKGRIIQDGFVCPHCGSDAPQEECKGKSYQQLENKYHENTM